MGGPQKVKGRDGYKAWVVGCTGRPKGRNCAAANIAGASWVWKVRTGFSAIAGAIFRAGWISWQGKIVRRSSKEILFLYDVWGKPSVSHSGSLHGKTGSVVFELPRNFDLRSHRLGTNDVRRAQSSSSSQTYSFWRFFITVRPRTKSLTARRRESIPAFTVPM